MLFIHKNIEFDIDERNITKEEVIEMFDIILAIIDVPVVEIVVESEEYASILLECDYEKSIKIANLITEKTGVETSDSDEDYGELEMINLYLDTYDACCGGCGHWDGSTCLNMQSPHYGTEGYRCIFIE